MHTHHMTRRQTSTALVWACLVLGSLSTTAKAQTAFPTKPITLVVTYPPGGGADGMARLIAPKMGEALGQSVVIENKPGASGNIGAELAARAAPDGYTIFWVSIGTAVSASLFPSLSYNLSKDFIAVSQATSVTSFLLVHPSLPVRSVGELIDYIKVHPGELSYSSSGTGGSPHLAAEWFKSRAGIELVHVPFKGTPEALTDIITGRIDIYFCPVISVLQFIKDGRLIPIVVAAPARLSQLPIVMVTSRSGEKHRARARQLGVDGYLTKPWQDEQLLATLRTLPGIRQ